MKRKSDDLYGTNFGHHDLFTIMEAVFMMMEIEKQKDKPR